MFSIDELFMNYFPTSRRLLGASPSAPHSLDLHRGSIPDPAGEFVPRFLICPNPGKNPAGAMARLWSTDTTIILEDVSVLYDRQCG